MSILLEYSALYSYSRISNGRMRPEGFSHCYSFYSTSKSTYLQKNKWILIKYLFLKTVVKMRHRSIKNLMEEVQNSKICLEAQILQEKWGEKEKGGWSKEKKFYCTFIRRSCPKMHFMHLFKCIEIFLSTLKPPSLNEIFKRGVQGLWILPRRLKF